MPNSKTILRDVSLFRFYVVLGITVLYCLAQLVTSHLTHSLILQIDAYHMMYNILSLLTCIITVKVSLYSQPA
jgi:Co/Zn/Cd efflux system component